MANELRDCKIAILATDGGEQVELEQPRQAVQAPGAQTDLLSIDDLPAFCDAIVREFSSVHAS